MKKSTVRLRLVVDVESDATLAQIVAEVQRMMIRRVKHWTPMHTDAARELGLTREGLYKLERRLGMRP